jgi:hypothetical protein
MSGRFPVLDFTGTTAANLKVSFWWNASYYWAVEVDYYNLELWISTDGGATWPTMLWSEDGVGVFTQWTWYEAVVPLTAYATETNVKLGWRYYGYDGAQAALDDIYVNDDGVPIGRCCYDAGASCADNTAAQCAVLGGTWDGALTCSTPCPITPVNDNCAGATAIGDVTNLAFSTSTATFDGPGGYITGKNLWYVYTLPVCVATASICGSAMTPK